MRPSDDEPLWVRHPRDWDWLDWLFLATLAACSAGVVTVIALLRS
jgi:hypothetical protein